MIFAATLHNLLMHRYFLFISPFISYNERMSIILYTKRGCPWCKGVLDLFNEKGVVFEEREVLGNKAYFDEMTAKSGQSKAPTLDVDGEILADTDKVAVAIFMKEKGVKGFE